MKLAPRAVLVAVAAAVVAQAGAAAPARMHLVTTPKAFLLWNQHDGLLGVGTCDVANDIHAGECVRGAIERTTDGGRTYHVVLSTHKPIGYLQSLGTGRALAVTYDDKSWRTLDGGRTWQQVRVRPPQAGSWLNARIGIRFRSYFTGNEGRLAMLVTHDGGRSWQRRQDPCEKAIASSAFADLVTPKMWWVACLGQPGAGNEDKAIFSTRDGGRTWREDAATLLISGGKGRHGGIQEYGYPAGLNFAKDGWGLLTETRGTLYVTRAGGVHWRAEPKVARPEVDFAGGAAVFRGGIGFVFLHDVEFSAGGRSRLIETRDYGRTWRVVRRWRG